MLKHSVIFLEVVYVFEVEIPGLLESGFPVIKSLPYFKPCEHNSFVISGRTRGSKNVHTPSWLEYPIHPSLPIPYRHTEEIIHRIAVKINAVNIIKGIHDCPDETFNEHTIGFEIIALR